MLEPGKVKIAVATVIKTHGIKGELNVELTDNAEPEEDFVEGACLIVEIDGLDVPFFVASARPRGADSMLLTLDGIDDESQAAALAGHTLYIYADASEADDGLTAGELIGYSIALSGEEGAVIGTVEELVELTPGCWYFKLRDSGRLIPAVDEMIEDVDSSRLLITMNLPEGLLEL